MDGSAIGLVAENSASLVGVRSSVGELDVILGIHVRLCGLMCMVDRDLVNVLDLYNVLDLDNVLEPIAHHARVCRSPIFVNQKPLSSYCFKVPFAISQAIRVLKAEVWRIWKVVADAQRISCVATVGDRGHTCSLLRQTWV